MEADLDLSEASKCLIEAIQTRLGYLKLASFDQVTPLLRKEINYAIKLHTEVTQQPDIWNFEHIGDLDTVYDQVIKHWTKVFDDFPSRVHLIKDIALFQQFLTAKLLGDYTEKSYVINPWTAGQASMVQQRQAEADSAEALDKAYQTHIVYPLEEMMLDRDHVEHKLVTAASKEPYPRGDVQRLIDKCDWSSLAATLFNDRILAGDLFAETPVDPTCFNVSTRTLVLRCIDELKDRYFATLSSPTVYTLKKRAVEMSGRQATRDSSASLMAHGDEKAPLIDSKKAQ